jgi:hypothetical protein
MTLDTMINAHQRLPKCIKKGPAAYVLSWPHAVYVGCSKEVRHRLTRHCYRKRKGVKRRQLYDQDWSAVSVRIYYTSTEEQAHQLETTLTAKHADKLLNMQKRWVQGHKVINGQCITVSFPGSKIAGKELGLCDSSIVSCLKGKTETSGGYKWKYL